MSEATGDRDDPLVLLRIAALSVEESASMVTRDDLDDERVRVAIAAASGRHLLDEAAQRPAARRSALRYVARMGGRATPYGLFAGTALATVGRRRAIELEPHDAHRVQTRIDVAALEGAVGAVLEARGADRWPLRANPLTRRLDGAVRFPRSGDVTSDVVEVRRSAAINAVLDVLGTGVLDGRALAEAVGERLGGVDPAAIATLVAGLVDAGLLQRAAGLVEPGVDPSRTAADLCEAADAGDAADALRALERSTCGRAPAFADRAEAVDAAWAQASEAVPSLAEVGDGRRYAHQLELATREAVVDRKTITDLLGAVRRIQRLSTPVGGELDALRRAFRERYEDAEVPVLEALDLETGVLQAPMRQISRLATRARIAADAEGDRPSVHPDVLDAYRRAAGARSVDVGGLEPDEAPRSRAILAALLDRHEGAYSSQLVGGLGRSPFSLMARFAFDRDELERAMRERIDAELAAAGASAPLPIELVAAPGGRIGNVLLRPKLLHESIALGDARGGTFPLERLGMRLHGEQIELRDLETGRPVSIELHSAHNVDLAGLDPVYTVLGRLAGGGGTAWDWGALDALDHLPRVTCGSVIVSPERWRLGAERVRSLLEAASPAAALRDAIGLDDGRRWLGVGENDQILPIDLSCDRSVTLALDGARDARIAEVPALESPVAASPGGRHVTEIVIGTGSALHAVAPASDEPIAYARERGVPWVYCRLHCGVSSADTVVRRAAETAGELRAAGHIDEWHFLRYAEGGHHIRVRMRAVPDHREWVLLEMTGMAAALRAEGIVTRCAFDEYVPEVARYGGAEALPLAQRLFTASSDQIASLLAEGADEDRRLARGVADVLAWTERIEPAAEERIALLRRCQSGLGVRFAGSSNQHGKLLREHREALEASVEAAAHDERVLAAAGELADHVRSRRPASLVRVLGSSLHMHCNRLFAFDAVRMELLTYEFAIRLLRGQHARSRERVNA